MWHNFDKITRCDVYVWRFFDLHYHCNDLKLVLRRLQTVYKKKRFNKALLTTISNFLKEYKFTLTHTNYTEVAIM